MHWRQHRMAWQTRAGQWAACGSGRGGSSRSGGGSSDRAGMFVVGVTDVSGQHAAAVAAAAAEVAAAAVAGQERLW